MSGATYQAIDPAVLMVAAGDGASFKMLSQTFLDHAEPIAGQLRQALADGQHAAIGRHSHALKGMAGLIGAATLISQLQQLETAARLLQPMPAATDAWMPSFEQVCREVALSLDDPAYGGA
ncbi:hypothetical protein Jab_2c08790 [Janthinobacterium sp. HH01]|uniref:Hpt domain-containing protein n=1 Tax=Janthinobacterium sp. HH01 TaxID=1198452 RepID=UPI0002AE8FAD|nr:Hpt domain-containing protein [Janthinobacterium sp. HH01]ELX08820.1 hypothetical protein Jab_2c08790 [Janthinobacterium sp. HH01]